MMKGTADFFGLNHYSSAMCGSKTTANESKVHWDYWSDSDIYTFKNASWLAGW